TGSLGVVLETAVEVTLTNTEVCKIPSNASGPLMSNDQKVGGLLLGHSSAGVKGLIIIPGVIDADYEGTIYIMAYTLNPPLFVPKGSWIAQILAFQSPVIYPPPSDRKRGSGGFGSTGTAVCFSAKLNHRPMIKVSLQQQGLTVWLNAMMDTGADITIVS
ncbi:POK9 protein, partial [Pygoscelis papua]